MKLKQRVCTLIFLITPFLFYAQAETIFNGVQLNESLEKTVQKISNIAKTATIKSVDNPNFPLAKLKEDHLVCSQVTTANGILDHVVFTFADDTLKYIEARGNVQQVFISKRKDTASIYLDYDVYITDKLVVNKKKDIAWILSNEALHTNLFAWENPYFDLNYKPITEPTSFNQIPVFLKMGASIDELKPLLEATSTFTNTEILDGSDPNAQIQINCFGVAYAGFPRKIEARFGDNKLTVAWILTGKGEEDRIRKALINQFGNPIFTNDDWEIFNNWQVGLRKDKPEVLLMEQSVGLGYKTSYFKQ